MVFLFGEERSIWILKIVLMFEGTKLIKGKGWGSWMIRISGFIDLIIL